MMASVTIPDLDPTRDHTVKVRARRSTVIGEPSNPVTFRPVAGERQRQIRLNGQWVDVSEAALATALQQLLTRSTQLEEGGFRAESRVLENLRAEIDDNIGDAVRALQVTVEENEDRIQVSADRIDQLIAEVGTKAAATALQALSTRVDQDGASIAANASLITSLTSQVSRLATAAAVQALTTRVVETENDITVNADAITRLAANIGGFTASAFSELAVRVTQVENVDGETVLAGLARWLVKTQIGDLVGGVGLWNDGRTVRFIVNADKFAILPPGATTNSAIRIPFAVSGGRVYIDEAVIRNGTITTLHAQNAFLTNLEARHGLLDIARIRKASVFDLDVSGEIRSTDYRLGSRGFRFTRGGTAQLPATAIIGRLAIGQIPATVAELSDIPAAERFGPQFGRDSSGRLIITTIDGGLIKTGTVEADHIDADVRNWKQLWTGSARLNSLTAAPMYIGENPYNFDVIAFVFGTPSAAITSMRVVDMGLVGSPGGRALIPATHSKGSNGMLVWRGLYTIYAGRSGLHGSSDIGTVRELWGVSTPN